MNKINIRNYKYLTSLFALVSLFSVSSFSDKMQHHHKHKMESKKMMPKDTKKKPLSEKDKKQLTIVFKANESLHAAFFDYQPKKIEVKAKTLRANMQQLENKELNRGLAMAAKTLSKISASQKREDNNKRYHIVSMALIDILKTYELGTKYASYSCPMVAKSWVQNTNKMEKVHNPYAPEMPHCGSKD